MEQNETIRKYELVVIVDARLTNDDKEEVRKQSSEIIEKSGGKVINSQLWLEKQKFTFEIKKCTEGTYYLINFSGQGEVVEKVRAALKLNEKILRFAVMQVEKKATAAA